MSYVLQQAEAEFVYTAISELKAMCIEPLGLIHDGLLLRSEDADALHIDTLNAKLQSKLSFERMAFDLKDQAPTEEDKQWLQWVVAQHSGTVLPHDEALVSRCVRKFLSDRDATVDLPPLDIARAVQPALVGRVVYSHPFWVYIDKGIVRLCDSTSRCTESEWFNPLLVRLLEQAFRDAIKDQEDAVEKLKQQMEQFNEREKLQETVKVKKATMTKLKRLRDRYLSPDTLRKVREALATEGMLADRSFKAELEQKRAEHNTGKLPFKNGVVNMHSRQLIQYTECTHYFYDFEIIQRDFREASDEEKTELWGNLLEPSLGKEQAAFFLRFLAGCLGGYTSWKLFVMIVGGSNSGKTMLTALVDSAFASLTGTFNSGNLIAKGNGSNDSEKAQSWLHELRYARVLLANETMNGGGRVAMTGHASSRLTAVWRTAW
jgi:hypothetical protein